MNKEGLMKSKKTLFVTATNTNVGKSFACAKLLEHYAQKGLSVGYFKPIETGVQNHEPNDGKTLLQITKNLNPNFQASLSDVVPYQFELAAAPFIAKGETKINLEFLKKQKEYLHQFCDVLIIEGAGGLMVPIELDFYMIDLIEFFHAKAILISPSNLGSINDTLLSMEALKSRDIKFKWLINVYKDKENFEATTLPFYKKAFKNVNYL